MNSEVYIDLIFFANFLMDYVLLRLTGTLLRCKANRWRCLGAAAIGAAGACVLIWADIRGPVLLFFLHGTVALLMLGVGLHLKTGRMLIRAMLTLYLLAFLCGGAWAVFVGGRIPFWTFLLFSAGTYLALQAWTFFTESFRAHVKNLFPVTLTYQGREQSLRGFYDTGNLLEEPMSHRAVCVTTVSALKELVPEELLEDLKKLKENPGELESTRLQELCPRLIPYHAVGVKDGLILAVTLDDLCIHMSGKSVHVRRPMLALMEEPFTFETEYEVLLNAKLLN